MAKNEIVTKLNNAVDIGLSASQMHNFEKAFVLAEARENLIKLLDNNVMKTFTNLQNSALGFKTDKKEGYPVDVVRTSIIQAVLTGVQVVGNHFNIIAGNCYITKEGFGYLLKNIENLRYEIIPGIPNIQGNAATIKMSISWKYKDEKESKEITFAIKTNQYMGSDGVIGKATRKARAWLYNTITDNELSDADAEEIEQESEVIKDENVAILEDSEETNEDREKKLMNLLTDNPYGIERVVKYLIHKEEMDKGSEIEDLISNEKYKSLRDKIIDDKSYFKSIINQMINLEEQKKRS